MYEIDAKTLWCQVIQNLFIKKKFNTLVSILHLTELRSRRSTDRHIAATLVNPEARANVPS